MILALLLACAEPAAPPARDGGADTAAPAEHRLPLDPPRLLRRLSLDLRGVVPTPAELAAVEADPAAVEAMRDAMLDDPRLEERLVDLLGEHWLTLVDDVTIQTQEAGFEPDQEYAFERAVGEQPLRTIARFIVEDRSWAAILTADTALVDEQLASIWPVDYPAGATGWQEVTWTDGRPAAGVLVSNGLWWRYSSNRSNANRARAAAISRLLLCDDYLARPVDLQDVAAIVDELGADAAIQEDPTCAGCHSTLDPLAATLFGFWWFEEHNVVELSWYHAAREPLGAEVLDVEPAWYGTPVDGLGMVAQALAADPRTSRCAVETFTALLWQRAPEVEEHAELTALQQRFEGEGQRVRPLLAAITDTPEYRAGALDEGAPASVADRTRVRRLLSPDQLRAAVADLTGYTWTWAGTDLLRNDSRGFRVLAGGLDGDNVTARQRTPGLTWALVVQRLAEAAADHAVTTELEAGQPGAGLLAGLDLDLRPGDPAFDAAVADLRWRLHAVRPDDTLLQQDLALWTALEAEVGAADAWRGLLALLLRDPDFVTE